MKGTDDNGIEKKTIVWYKIVYVITTITITRIKYKIYIISI